MPHSGYEISQYNIIVDILGGWSTDMEVAVKELVGRRQRDVLKKMQRACLSIIPNIARTFKIVTHKTLSYLCFGLSPALEL